MVVRQRIAVVEFGTAEVVGGAEADATGAEFGTEILLLAGETLEARLG